MKVQVQVGGKWRDAEAKIDANGYAIVALPHPYEARTFKMWRKAPKAKRARQIGKQ